MLVDHEFLKKAVAREGVLLPEAILHVNLSSIDFQYAGPMFAQIRIQYSKVEDFSDDNLKRIASILVSSLLSNQELMSSTTIIGAVVQFCVDSLHDRVGRLVVTTFEQLETTISDQGVSVANCLTLSLPAIQWQEIIVEKKLLSPASRFKFTCVDTHFPGVYLHVGIGEEKQSEVSREVGELKQIAFEMGKAIMEKDSTIEQVGFTFYSDGRRNVRVRRDNLAALNEGSANREAVVESLECTEATGGFVCNLTW